MHQKGREDLYDSSMSSCFLGQGYCWLVQEENVSKNRVFFTKSLSILFGDRVLGHTRHGHALVFLYLFPLTLQPNKQCLFFYLVVHVICKEQMQALNLALLSLHSGMLCSKFIWQQRCCVKSYSKCSRNFQILSAEKSPADIT